MVAAEYADRYIDCANPLFLTAGSDGRTFLSTEHNYDPADDTWCVGDLKPQSVEEIYRSPRRREIVERCNRLRWGPEVSQSTGRTARLTQITKAVMSDALGASEIELIRRAPLGSHRRLLD